MGFSVGKYAKIWAYENKGNYSTCRLTVSRKNKDTGAYDVEFSDGFVRLVGNAHKAIQNVPIGEKGYSIKITSCDVSNVYTSPEGKTNYTPHYTIFEFEDASLQNNSDQKNKTGNISGSPAKAGQDVKEFMNIPDSIDEELPFE